MRRLRGSLTAKLIIWTLLLSIVSLAIVNYIAFRSAQQIIISRTMHHLESVSILKQQEISNWIECTERDLVWLAAQPQITKDTTELATYAPSQPQNESARETLAAEFQRSVSRDSLQIIFLMDIASGEVIAASDEAWEGKLFESQPYFIEGVNATYISDIYYSLSLGAPTMIMSTPVNDQSGDPLGVLAAHINLQGLNEIMLESSGLGQTGETYLVNKDNLRLTDSRFGGAGTAFRQWIFTEGVRQALEGRSAAELYTGYRGVPVIGFSQWLGDAQAVLLAEIDQEEAFAPVHNMRDIMVIAGFALIAVIIGAVVVGAQRITRPIKKLVNYAGRVEEGDYSSKPEVRGRDEVASLTSHINSMVDKLLARERKLHTLSRRLVQIQEEERRAIARELHDQTSQSLALTRMLLDRSISAPPSERISWLEKAQDELSGVIDQVRQMSLDLRPAMLDDMGLVPTLRWHFDRYTSRTNISVNFDPDGVVDGLSPELRITAYRIVQEALNNVAKHARVNEAEVRLWIEGERLHILVKDSGVGFDPARIPPTSIGLSGMQERARLWGGQLNVDSAPSAGTRLTANLPLVGPSENETS